MIAPTENHNAPPPETTEYWFALLDEATTLLELIVQNNPEKEIPYGDFARKYRAALAIPRKDGAGFDPVLAEDIRCLLHRHHQGLEVKFEAAIRSLAGETPGPPTEECRWCKRKGHWPMICKSTRDMEDKKHDLICDAELLKAGGGEYSANQERASRRGEPAPASPVLNVGVEGGRLIGQAQALSCDDQFAIATAVAANVGCVLGPDAYAASPAPGGESEEEKIARIIFDKTVGVGLSIWRNEFYAGERLGCYKTARTILATLSRPQPGEGVREALLDCIHVLDGLMEGEFSPVGSAVAGTLKRAREVYRARPSPQPSGERAAIIEECARELFTQEELDAVYGMTDEICDYIERCRSKLHLEGGIRGGVQEILRRKAIPLLYRRAKEAIAAALPLSTAKQGGET